MLKSSELAKQLGLANDRGSFRSAKAGDALISVKVHVVSEETGETIQDLDITDATQAIIMLGTPTEVDGQKGTALGGLMLCGPQFMQNAIENLKEAFVKTALHNMSKEGMEALLHGLADHVLDEISKEPKK